MMHRLEYWTKFWKTRKPGPLDTAAFQLLRKEAGKAKPLELITAEDVEEALKPLGNKHAPGIDGWTLSLFKRLPKEGKQALADLLNATEQAKAWPQAVAINDVIFLGKPTPTPSERPITLTSALYRLYCRVRKTQ